MNKIILLASLTIIGILGVGQMAFADNSTLSVSPATINSTVGTAFNVSVQLNPANNKVCVVKGTVSVNKLACQSITVASGLYTAMAPTCANPAFLIGIPKCTTAVQNILSMSVKGTSVGQANLSIADAKVIGAGVNVPFSLQGGAYNIAVAPVTSPKITATPNVDNITEAVQPTEQPVIEQVATPTPQPSQTPKSNLSANGGPAGFAAIASPYFWPLLIILIILGIGYGIYWFAKKKPVK